MIVEQSPLSVRRTLEKIGVPRALSHALLLLIR